MIYYEVKKGSILLSWTAAGCLRGTHNVGWFVGSSLAYDYFETMLNIEVDDFLTTGDLTVG